MLARKRGAKKCSVKGGKWSRKYKNSIDCNHPRGFSQKQHCKYGRKKIKKKQIKVQINLSNFNK